MERTLDLPLDISNAQKLELEIAHSTSSNESPYPSLQVRSRRFVSDSSISHYELALKSYSESATSDFARTLAKREENLSPDGSRWQESLEGAKQGPDRRDDRGRTTLPQENYALQRKHQHSRHVNSYNTYTSAPFVSGNDDFDHADAEMWTKDRVMKWLEDNSFGREWQETFSKENIEKEEVRRCFDSQTALTMSSFWH